MSSLVLYTDSTLDRVPDGPCMYAVRVHVWTLCVCVCTPKGCVPNEGMNERTISGGHFLMKHGNMVNH